MVANEQVRVFRLKAKSAVVGISACSYRTDRTTRLWYDDAEGPVQVEPRTFKWAINGDYVAFAIGEAGSNEPTDESAGLSTEDLIVWNSRTAKRVRASASLQGVRFTGFVVASDGTVGAIANPYRFGVLPDGTRGPLTASYIVSYKPSFGSAESSESVTWNIVSQAPIGSLRGLTTTANRLVWLDAAGAILSAQ